MRISFLAPGYPWQPSGGMRVIYEYANGLAARGHDLAVIHPRKLDTPHEKLSAYKIVRDATFNSTHFFRKPSVNWQQIDRRVKMLYVPTLDSCHIPDAEAVFATAWQTAPYVLDYPRSKGEKFYLIQGYETWGGPKDLVDSTWRSPLHKVVISKWLVDVGKQLGCEELGYISNAINHKMYRLIRPIEGRKPRVAMIYSKLWYKGTADGLQAVAIARQKFPKLEAVFFGKTRLRPSVPKWIEYHRNPPQNYIIGEIYNRSAIFLSSSLSEGWALPPAEAAACGCAVVATNSGGICDYIEHERSGLLSPPGDPSALAENLCSLLADNDRRIRLARACNDSVGRLSWERNTDQMENFIARAVGQAQIV